jgi:drug/metabolite transporter superfamily protein YnfA
MDCDGVRTLMVFVFFGPGTFKVYTLFRVSHAALISLDCLLSLISFDIISCHRIHLFGRTYLAQDKKAEALPEGEIGHPRDRHYR